MGNTAGLDGLVIGPYLWNAVTYSGFFRDAYDNVIKVEVERLQKHDVEKRKQVELVNNGKSKNATNGNSENYISGNQKYDVQVAHLVNNLVDESGKVLGKENWTDIIGTELWNILKLDEYGKDRYKLDNEKDDSSALKKRSVVQLLKFIRNKISHIRTCKDEMKEKLTVFFDLDHSKQYHFNENKFVSFWISKFPKLVPYLWLKLYKFKLKLVNYYPDYEIEMTPFKDILMDLNKIGMELQSALIADMENGNVVKRFKGPACSLEFREFHNLVRIPDKFVFVKVAVNSTHNGSMFVSHSSTNQDKLEYVGSAPGNEKLIIIFADSITDNKIWKFCSNCSCRVIVFCDPDKLTNEKIEDAVGKFKYENDLTEEFFELPIRGNELSIEKQDWLFDNGQVYIQGIYMKIQNIISNRSEMLEELSGNFLNKLLKQENVQFCENYKFPEYQGVYIPRKLYFTDASGKQCEVNSKDEKMEWLYNWFLENEFFEKAFPNSKDSNNICKMCKKERSNECENPYQTTPKEGVYDEIEFLRRVFDKDIKTVYFYAESGMGKSKLLLSLGKRMTNSLVIFCPFRHFVDLLKKRVGMEECKRSNITSIILEILGCRDECEIQFIRKWLNQKNDKGARIHLQLDGLDEVPNGNLDLALTSLKIIENDFDSIRLWISSSKPWSDAEQGLKFTYCTISPFSLEDKINYFKKSCRAKYVGLSEEELKDYINDFSVKLAVHEDLSEFLNYPLNYSMLFELYDDNVTELALLTGQGITSHLFESLYQKKFAIMYREKKGILLDDEDDDFKMQRESYLQFHTHLALIHLFPGVSDEFPQPQGMEFFTKESYQKMGIITNSEPLTFIHVKYADFLVARYIVKVLEKGKLEGLCPEELFLDTLRFGTPEKDDLQNRSFIWKFVDEYLGKVADWSILKWLETHKPPNCDSVATEKTVIRFLIRAFNCFFWSLAKLTINLWTDKTNTNFCNKILYLALISNAPLNWFKDICDKLCNDNHNELLVCSLRQGNYEIAKYLIEEKCGDDAFDKIAEKRECGGGIFNIIVDRITLENSFNNLDLDFVENTIDFIKFVHKMNAKEIERKDIRGRNFLLALPLVQKTTQFLIPSEQIFPLKELLIKEMNADVNQTSNDGKSILCMELDLKYKQGTHSSSICFTDNCKEEFDFKIAEVYHKTLELVTSKKFAHINLKSKAGRLTPLEEAVRFLGSNLRKDSLEIFRACGANFNELDGEGDTILHYCVKNCDDIEFVKQLVKYGSKIDVQNGKHLCALCLAQKEGKVELISFFRKMMRLKGKQKCPLNCANELHKASG